MLLGPGIYSLISSKKASDIIHTICVCFPNWRNHWQVLVFLCAVSSSPKTSSLFTIKECEWISGKQSRPALRGRAQSIAWKTIHQEIHTWVRIVSVCSDCILYSGIQERKEVRRRPGQEASLAPPCSNLSSSGNRFSYCIEESTCDIVETFRRSISGSAPGDCAPLAHRYAPGGIVFHQQLH